MLLNHYAIKLHPQNQSIFVDLVIHFTHFRFLLGLLRLSVYLIQSLTPTVTSQYGFNSPAVKVAEKLCVIITHNLQRLQLLSPGNYRGAQPEKMDASAVRWGTAEPAWRMLKQTCPHFEVLHLQIFPNCPNFIAFWISVFFPSFLSVILVAVVCFQTSAAKVDEIRIRMGYYRSV